MAASASGSNMVDCREDHHRESVLDTAAGRLDGETTRRWLVIVAVSLVRNAGWLEAANVKPVRLSCVQVDRFSVETQRL